MQYPRKGDVPPGYGGEGGGGGMTLMKAGVVSLVIALIVVFGTNMLGFLGVASSTYNDFVDYAQTNYALKTEIPAAVQGPQGAQGVQGAQGIQGTQGVGIASAAIDSDGHLVLTLTDGSTIDAGAVSGETGDGATAETTRWTVTSVNIVGYSGGDFTWDVSTDPRKIQDEDLYEIELTMYSSAGFTQANAQIEIVLTPNEYCPINEDDTYLDSDDVPYLTWDSDFTIKTREGIDVCRRMTFTSEKFTLTLPASPGYKAFTLVLELHYGS